MKNTFAPTIITFSIVLALLCSAVIAQDKNDLRVPDGLGFSDFKGYEAWQVVSVSHPSGGESMSGSDTLNIIVANPAMIEAYAAGIPL